MKNVLLKQKMIKLARSGMCGK